MTKSSHAFTLVELLIVVTILGILASAALPSFNSILESTRADNKTSELTRLLYFARAEAISSENFVTLCPLQNNACVNNWNLEIVVFNDINLNRTIDGNERVLRVISPIPSHDFLQHPFSSVSYDATGMLANRMGSSFRYCPGTKNSQYARRIIVSSHTGRVRYSDEDTECR
ncbi:GspH/FimT family pseudopilin [Flocculibacter collagenilyticus]|uniref:GspH/FimT family pseudopilin n=1 Tax=Flocculibacter collagenilyticus TaxID=2744479 RepID=UPI0018F39119|nr:GspH/FimT family pseudopilin [Flocculibacter collagenilyticus]